MRTFAELSASERLVAARDTELGAEYWLAGGGPRVWSFERAGAEVVASYVQLQRYAHLWIHRDYEHDAWHRIDVDEPIEVGADYVVMPRRTGNAIASFERGDDPAAPPPELAEMRRAVRAITAAAAEPLDRAVGELVSRRVLGPDDGTILVWAERRFYVQDVAATRDELDAWREAVARHGAASQWLER
jgi:hypothetical protein